MEPGDHGNCESCNKHSLLLDCHNCYSLNCLTCANDCKICLYDLFLTEELADNSIHLTAQPKV